MPHFVPRFSSRATILAEPANFGPTSLSIRDAMSVQLSAGGDIFHGTRPLPAPTEGEGGGRMARRVLATQTSHPASDRPASGMT